MKKATGKHCVHGMGMLRFPVAFIVCACIGSVFRTALFFIFLWGRVFFFCLRFVQLCDGISQLADSIFQFVG